MNQDLELTDSDDAVDEPVMGRPPHEPTPQTRHTVRHMSKIGMRQSDIAICLKISEPTLRKHYREEIDEGSTEGKVQVMDTLYSMATDGKHPSATIFFAKTRCGICQPRESAALPAKDQAAERAAQPRKLHPSEFADHVRSILEGTHLKS